jgi:hypothetical protein
MLVRIEKDELYPNYVLHHEVDDKNLDFCELLDLPDELVKRYEKVQEMYKSVRRELAELVESE